MQVMATTSASIDLISQPGSLAIAEKFFRTFWIDRLGERWCAPRNNLGENLGDVGDNFGENLGENLGDVGENLGDENLRENLGGNLGIFKSVGILNTL